MRMIGKLVAGWGAVLAVALPLVLGATAAAADGVEFRIGWQKGSNLAVIKAKGEFEKHLKAKGIAIQWTEFPAGPQMLEGLNVGSIDFGVVGETPPVFAQAAGAELLYVGNEPPSPRAEAILVPANSPIKTVADLKGKRLTLNKGSNVHYLLVRALEKAGLQYGDVQTSFLKPSDARAAFEAGAVDAWVIWDPYATAAVEQLGARVLTDGVGIADNYNYYIGTKAFAAAHPDVLKVALQEIDTEDKWVAGHLKEAAAIIGQQIGLPEAIAETALGHYAYGAHLLTTDVVAKQQTMSDVFTALHLIPVRLDINAVVWRPTP